MEDRKKYLLRQIKNTIKYACEEIGCKDCPHMHFNEDNKENGCDVTEWESELRDIEYTHG